MSRTTEKQIAGEQKLPRPSTVRLIIIGVSSVVTVRMVLAAIEHNQWREFIVSEVAIVATAIALLVLLRDSKMNRNV